MASALSVGTLFLRKDGLPFRAAMLLTLADALEIAAWLIAITWGPKEAPNSVATAQRGPPSALDGFAASKTSSSLGLRAER